MATAAAFAEAAGVTEEDPVEEDFFLAEDLRPEAAVAGEVDLDSPDVDDDDEDDDELRLPESESESEPESLGVDRRWFRDGLDELAAPGPDPDLMEAWPLSLLLLDVELLADDLGLALAASEAFRYDVDDFTVNMSEVLLKAGEDEPSFQLPGPR